VSARLKLITSFVRILAEELAEKRLTDMPYRYPEKRTRSFMAAEMKKAGWLGAGSMEGQWQLHCGAFPEKDIMGFASWRERRVPLASEAGCAVDQRIVANCQMDNLAGFER